MTNNLQNELDAVLAQSDAHGRTVASEVYGHPISEDMHREAILDYLDERPPSTASNRLHVGVAGFFNFDVAAHSRPDAMLLLDYNKAQQQYWNIVIKNLAAHKTPEDFIDAMRMDLTREYTDPKGLRLVEVEDYPDYLYLDAHWLTDEAYPYFHDLAKNHKILTGTIDLLGSHEQASALGEFIKQKGFHVDSCYWSNIGQYVRPIVGSSDHGSDGPVYSDEMHYLDSYYDRTTCAGIHGWDGEEHKDNGTRLSFSELPGLERFLRNISVIGGPKSLHMMTSNLPEKAKPDLLTGIMRLLGADVPDLSSYVDYQPIFFEGPPRRTPEQWAKREEARRAQTAATEAGRAVY